MQNNEFCYWLQGWLEIEKPRQINSLQLQEIKNHLDLTLNKPSPKTWLSGCGILNYPDPLRETNKEREKNGLPPLYC